MEASLILNENNQLVSSWLRIVEAVVETLLDVLLHHLFDVRHNFRFL